MEEHHTPQAAAQAASPVPPTPESPDPVTEDSATGTAEDTAPAVSAAANGRTPLLAGAIVAAVFGGIALGALTTDDSPTISGPSASHLAPVDETEQEDAPAHAFPEAGDGGHAAGGDHGVEPEPEPAPTPSAPTEQVTESEPSDVELPPEATVVERGEDVVVGDFLVTFGATEMDAAWRFEGNQGSATYVDELSEGEILVLGTLTVTNQSEEPLDPTIDLFTSFLGTDGRDYNLLNAPFCMAEDSLLHFGNLAPGQSATGTVCQGVPAAAALGGVWQLRPDSNYSAVTYFASQSGIAR